MIAVSHASAAAFSGHAPFKRRLRTIHNGTALDKFPLKDKLSALRFKASLGIPEDSFVVCALGQICARKGLLEVLQAFRRIHVDAPKMHLAVVGKAVFEHEEAYRDSLVAYAAATGIKERVHFTGERRDVSEVLQGSDLLVLNSHQEPFGLVLVESMSSGTPVLAARVGGIPEIVTDGLDGWLVANGDTNALAEKMLQLSRDTAERDAIAERAYRFTRPQFSLERFKSDLHSFYSALKQSRNVQLTTNARPALASHGED